MKIKIWFFSLFIITLLMLSCYGEISGTVVDAETGEPIEGAVVLVEWTMTKGLPGMSYTESYKVVEVVTDKDGKFTVSGTSSPLANPPHVTIYKRGYVAWNNEFIFPSWERRKDFDKNRILIKFSNVRLGFCING